MPENVVLANLIINADGTILAVNKAGQVVALQERQITSSVSNIERKARSGFDGVGISAKRLTDGFINMRRLISGLFLGFSVGGLVFQLAHLITSTIAATTWFQKAKTGAEDFFRALVLGEDAFERYNRKAAALGKDIGITTTDEILGKIKSVTEFLENRLRAISELPPGSAEVARISKDVNVARAKLDELRLAYDKLGTTAKKAAEAIAGGLGGAGDFAGRFEIGPAKDSETIKGRDFSTFDTVALGLDRQMEALKAGDLAWDSYNAKVSKATELLEQLGFTQQQVAEIPAVQLAAAVQEQTHQFDQQIETIQEWILVLGAAAAASAAAADAGIGSQKRLFQISQLLLAAQAYQKGLFELGEALGAAARYDYGSAALHYAASTLYFAAAAFHGVAAAKGPSGAGRGGGGRGGRDFSEAPEQTPPGRPPTQYVINVDGIIVGTDENSIGRWIAENLNKVRRDNVRVI
jgi:hypothetical protein